MKQLTVSIMLLLSLFCAAFPAPTLAQHSPTTVTMAFVEGDPGSLDPQIADTINDFLVLRNVYEGLVNYDPKTLQPVPCLAEKWEISPDGNVYTFHLRQGVKFQNGRIVTAKDVKYSLERLANPATGKSYTKFLLDSVEGIDAVRGGQASEVRGLRVVDEYTFEITLVHPVASFLNQLTLPGAFVVPQEVAEKPDFAQNPVGTGPFRFVQWVRQQQVTLEANPDYWGTPPSIKFVVLRVIPNSLQQVDDFKAGKVDITVAPPFELPNLQRDPDLASQLEEIPPLAITYLILNLKDPALSKAEVRRAINLGIDREALLNSVLKGQGRSAQGIFPPVLSAYDDSAPFPYDPATARQLLAGAGYGNGLQLSAILATDEADKRVMSAIQAQLADIGVDISINSTDKTTADTLRKACNGQMFVSTWTGDYADPDDFAPILISSTLTGTACGYTQYDGVREVSALLAQASAMQPGPERDSVYRQAQKLAMERAIIVPIYYRSKTVLVSAALKGAYLDATLSVNFANITIVN